VFINSPAFFYFIYSIVKPWIDERTRSKILVLKSDYKEKLFEFCDEDQIPKFLGGTCECVGGCDNSDKGPWNDYEPVQPFGFREKENLPISCDKIDSSRDSSRFSQSHNCSTHDSHDTETDIIDALERPE